MLKLTKVLDSQLNQLWGNQRFIIHFPYATLTAEFKPGESPTPDRKCCYKVDIDGRILPLWVFHEGTPPAGPILKTMGKETDMPPSPQHVALGTGVWTFEIVPDTSPIEEPVEPPIEEPPVEGEPEEPAPLDPSKINCLVLCKNASKLPLIAQSYVAVIEPDLLDGILDKVREATLQAIAAQLVREDIEKRNG